MQAEVRQFVTQRGLDPPAGGHGMFGLEEQPDPGVRLGHHEEAAQGHDRFGPAVDRVPGAHVESGDLVDRAGVDPQVPVTDAGGARIVEQDRDAVGGEADVHLERLRALVEGLLVGDAGEFGEFGRGAAVGDDAASGGDG